MDGGASVHAHADRRAVVTSSDLPNQPQAEPDGKHRVVSARHDGVAEQLDFLGMVRWHQVTHALDEFTRELGRRPVSVRFGHRRVADKVHEQEGVKRLGHWSRAIGRDTAIKDILPGLLHLVGQPSRHPRAALLNLSS